MSSPNSLPVTVALGTAISLNPSRRWCVLHVVTAGNGNVFLRFERGPDADATKKQQYTPLRDLNRHPPQRKG